MRRLALLLALLWPLAVGAQVTGDGMGDVYAPPSSGAPAYSGPCDVVSGCTGAYGLRLQRSAYGTGNAANIRRASDNSTMNITYLSGGAFDIATANSFAGTDATASCTLSGTTATCTGASSTPNVTDTVAGSGLTEPCFVTAVGTFTGGAGTMTVKIPGAGTSCGTISVAETFTMQYGMFVTELYDNTSNGFNVSQATAADQPQLMPNCLNGLPCIYANVSSQSLRGTITNSANASFAGVGNRQGNFTSTQVLIGKPGSATLGWPGVANEIGLDTTSTVLSSVSDGAWHAMQGVYGSTSYVCADGTCGTGTTSAPGVGTTVGLMSTAAGGNYLNGYFAEADFWSTTNLTSPTQTTAVCHNQYSYWGTSVSC
jgi:hypothetical protein